MARTLRMQPGLAFVFQSDQSMTRFKFFIGKLIGRYYQERAISFHRLFLLVQAVVRDCS